MRYPYLLRGDHIYIDLGKWLHHGIYYGDNKVIHFHDGKICMDSIRRFSCRRRVCVQKYQRCSPRKRVLARAKDRLDQKGYNLLFNNCEHFATWCKTGKPTCKQLEKLDKSVPKAVKYFGNCSLRKLSRISVLTSGQKMF